MEKALVLLSNDDGVGSPGLRILRDAVATFADVIVLAPEGEQSASSHSLTLHRPLRLRQLDAATFSLDGTPADCVYVALHGHGRVLPRRPDLCISGINHGLNLGQDAFYSGTVAAAREAALRRIPSIASSAHPGTDLARVANLTAALAKCLLSSSPALACLLNLNVPKNWSGEVRPTRLGARIYEEVVDFRRDPRGREYLWLGGPDVRHERDDGTDTDAYDDGAASITPLVLDLTEPQGATFTRGLVERLGSRASS